MKLKLSKELEVVKHAFLLYSRIPVGRVAYSEELAARSFAYLPLVGGGVAVLMGAFLLGAAYLVPKGVALLLAMALGLLLTGAMHEDGLADFADGFGGGFTRERILEIMKDSSMGVYGAITLGLSLLLTYVALDSLPLRVIPTVLLVAQMTSRFPAILLSYSSHYVRSERSKFTHSACKMERRTLLIAFVIALLPMLLLLSPMFWLPLLLLYTLLYYGMKRYVAYKIGGYTGDVLGALQQLSYLGCLILLTATPYELYSI